MKLEQAIQKGNIKEDYVLGKLKSAGISCKIFRPTDFRGRGVPQVYDVRGSPKSRPDINVYVCEGGDVIFMVEVKGFIEFQEVNGSKNFVGIEKRKFENYMEVALDSEVPIKVVFVIGENGSNKYKIYWDDVFEMAKYKSVEKDLYFYSSNSKIKFLLWSINDLGWGMDTLIDSIKGEIANV